MASTEAVGISCEPCITHWAEENIDDLRSTSEADSQRFSEILGQIRQISNLPDSEKRQKLERIIEILDRSASKEELQHLLDTIDISLSDFLGDPRRLLACFAQIFSCLESDAEKTQNAIQRFIRDKQIGQVSSPAPFDWTMVDILLSQLSHLAGKDAVFTREMRDSIVLSLFPLSGEAHFLQDLVSQFLLMSVGEKISMVRRRMRSLSQAPLSKVTLLSNMVIEIHEKYERQMSEIRASMMNVQQPTDEI